MLLYRELNRQIEQLDQHNENDQKKYAAEVSLVGNLYESKIHELLALMEDYTRGYLKSLMDIQSKLYGCFILDMIASPLIVHYILYIMK